MRGVGVRIGKMERSEPSMDSGVLHSAIRDVLECPCCSQLLQSPLLISSCGHCFCSVCIRRWLLSKSTCPVCNCDMDESNLITCSVVTKMVDALQGTGRTSNYTTSTIAAKRVKLEPQTERLPTTVYHVISDEKLDDLLKASGLPTNGSRESKINLHREYTLAYNAEIDAGVSDVDLAKVRKTVISMRKPRLSTSFFHQSSASVSSRSETVHTYREPRQIDWLARRARMQARARERLRWTSAQTSRDWRAIFSDRLNKPVYYNVRTGECTVERATLMEEAHHTANPGNDEDDEIVLVVENQ